MIDAHVHLLPGRLAEKVRAFFDLHLADHLVYPLDHGAVLERLSGEGVTGVWSLPYAHRPGVAEGLNEASAATVRAARSGAVPVIGGATVHPGDDDPVAVVRTAVEDLGLRIVKLHCSVGDFAADDPRLDGLWAYVSEHHVPVTVHAGHGVSGHTEPDELVPVARVATRFPDARIVIAHCGHHAVNEALDLLDVHPNVHADLTPVVREFVAVPPHRAALLADRLLFGTDAPNTALTASEALAHLDSLGLGDEARAAVTGGNAVRLVMGVRG